MIFVGQPDCGDIDIIVTRSTDDGKDHSGLVQRLVETLYAQGLVGQTLTSPEDWRSLDAKWNGLIIGDDSKMRRIDILGKCVTTYSQRLSVPADLTFLFAATQGYRMMNLGLPLYISPAMTFSTGH